MNFKTKIFLKSNENYVNILNYFDKDTYSEKEYTYLEYYNKRSLFKLAIIKNKKNIIKNLYDLVHISEKDIDLLIDAINANNTELSKLLLNNGVNPFFEGRRMALTAMIYKRNVEIIKLILQHPKINTEIIHYCMNESLECGYYDIFELFKKHNDIYIKINIDKDKKKRKEQLKKKKSLTDLLSYWCCINNTNYTNIND